MNPKLAACVRKCTYQSHHINSPNEGETDLMGHDNIIQQAATDGNIVSISHCSQRVTLRDSKKEGEVKLCHAFRVGDDVLLCHEVHQHSRGNDRGLTDGDQWTNCLGKSTWGVQARTEPNQYDHAQVPHHPVHINSQEEEEKGQLESWLFCEPSEDELSH